MSNTETTIHQLFAGQYPGVGVRSVVIDDHLEGREVNLISELDFGKNLALVCDPATYEASGKRIEHALSSAFKIQLITLGNNPHPDEETLQKLSQALAPETDAVIAVGSGTINDLCKMAAFRKGCPQVVFGTAPSMNGYTSANAAITVGGLKKTLPAAAPTGVFLDLSVLAKAPKRLIRSGLGDSLCRPTAQADWLLAHLLLDQKYNELPFEILMQDEAALFSQSRALLSGDLAAMKHLARTLVLSGFGMTICGGSYPASQGEHLISHYMDMLHAHALPESFHGEQIGVTTLAMARLQEEILSLKQAPRLRPTFVDKEAVLAHFGEKLGEACWKEFEPKRLDEAKAETLNARLEKNWDSIRDRIHGVAIASEKLKRVLLDAEAPTAAADLGWPEELFAQACAHAREIRNRYTFLDFGFDLRSNS